MAKTVKSIAKKKDRLHITGSFIEIIDAAVKTKSMNKGRYKKKK
jgi:hypothetical protein